jgi:transcriptional regulator with XRE-family HTH domain
MPKPRKRKEVHPMKEVGPILAKLRKEKGLGQKELSALLNLSVGTISNYENSVHAPDLNTLCRLADYFEVTTDYLLGRTDYRCPPEALKDYVVSDYTVCKVVNTILSFDSEKRNSVLMYLDYMKDSHNRAGGGN